MNEPWAFFKPHSGVGLTNSSLHFPPNNLQTFTRGKYFMLIASWWDHKPHHCYTTTERTKIIWNVLNSPFLITIHTSKIHYKILLFTLVTCCYRWLCLNNFSLIKTMIILNIELSEQKIPQVLVSNQLLQPKNTWFSQNLAKCD